MNMKKTLAPIICLSLSGLGILMPDFSNSFLAATPLVQVNAAWPAITIDFNELFASNGSPFTTYSESGFTVLSASGNWLVGTSYGHPPPYIYFTGTTDQSLTAGVRVTNGGSAFKFSSVDLYSSITQIPYTFTGFLNSKIVFTATGTVPNTFGDFAKVLNPNSTKIIDALEITLVNPATACCGGNPMGLDNLVMVPAAQAASYNYTTLDNPIALDTHPTAINNNGQVVGYYDDATGSHGFVYSGGIYTTLDNPDAIPGTTYLTGINNSRQVVGYYEDGKGIHGFLSSPVNTQWECLFNWAETAYSNLFSPPGATSQLFPTYTHRYYSNTQSYVGISFDNSHVYYLGQTGLLEDVGDLYGWLTKAGCQ